MTGGQTLQTVLLSLEEEKVMGETPQSLMTARLSRKYDEEEGGAGKVLPGIYFQALLERQRDRKVVSFIYLL